MSKVKLNNLREVKMKKILFLIIFLTISNYSLAESGKFNAAGAGSWSLNAMDAGNGNMSITYDLSLIHI